VQSVDIENGGILIVDAKNWLYEYSVRQGRVVGAFDLELKSNADMEEITMNIQESPLSLNSKNTLPSKNFSHCKIVELLIENGN